MIEQCCYNDFFFGLFEEEKMKTREDKRLVNMEFFSLNLPFLGIFKKNQHIHFLVHGHSSWSMFGLHLVRGPKTL